MFVVRDFMNVGLRKVKKLRSEYFVVNHFNTAETLSIQILMLSSKPKNMRCTAWKGLIYYPSLCRLNRAYETKNIGLPVLFALAFLVKITKWLFLTCSQSPTDLKIYIWSHDFWGAFINTLVGGAGQNGGGPKKF